MTLQEARTIRDEMRGYGIKCTVPLRGGPDGYFVQINVGIKERVYCLDTWMEIKKRLDERKAVE